MSSDEDLDILWYSRIGDLDLFFLALEKIPSLINSKDENGNTIAHMAAANGHIHILKGLLTFGEASSLINSQNFQGNSPLHWAVINKKYELMNVLIDNGANLTIENGFNETPVDVALKLDDTKALSLFEKKVENASNSEYH